MLARCKFRGRTRDQHRGVQGPDCPRRDRARHSVGNDVPRSRPHPGHRKTGTAARRRRRQAAAAGGRRIARGACPWARRAARRDDASAVRQQRADLLELRRRRGRRRRHRSCARQAERRCDARLPPRQRRGDFSAAAEEVHASALRFAAGVGSRGQPVHNTRRARPDAGGAKPVERPGQDRPPDRRRKDSCEQSIREAAECAAGNLQLRQSQCPGCRVASDHRRTLGARARPAGWRRGQHHPSGPQLRLAGDHLRRELRDRNQNR